jgi:uncharacterized membrane protein
MINFPPIPSWDGLHPLIVHFPIALLLIAPLFVVVGALLPPDKGRAWFLAALVLMAIGTILSFVAVSTGKAAGELAERNEAVSAVLDRHEELAETTRIVFAALTVIFATIILAPAAMRRVPSRVTSSLLTLVFLLFYGAGGLLLVNTAHNGGRLVHELGVHAMVAQSGGQPAATTPPGEKAEEKD